ncbi:TMEM165/GDT1 family protein [Sphingomonas sp. RB3P16]|uniref:TMEM165/GDT1 family protein n=1 Tax=Parasphingomonas frigoris TaxID=3096163 RepID=UPI002FC88D00
MAALVAALLTQASDRAPWTAALLGDRYAGKGAVIAATALALAIGNTISVVGGLFVASLLSPNARDLLLALALLSAGVSGCWPIKPAKLRNWRLGAFGTSLLTIAMLSLGDRMQFITAALAVRSTTPALAAVGATIGALVVTTPAILLGSRTLRTLPTTAIRLGSAAVLLVFGTVQALAALRLI